MNLCFFVLVLIVGFILALFLVFLWNHRNESWFSYDEEGFEKFQGTIKSGDLFFYRNETIGTVQKMYTGMFSHVGMFYLDYGNGTVNILEIKRFPYKGFQISKIGQNQLQSWKKENGKCFIRPLKQPLDKNRLNLLEEIIQSYKNQKPETVNYGQLDMKSTRFLHPQTNFFKILDLTTNCFIEHGPFLNVPQNNLHGYLCTDFIYCLMKKLNLLLDEKEKSNEVCLQPSWFAFKTNRFYSETIYRVVFK